MGKQKEFDHELFSRDDDGFDVADPEWGSLKKYKRCYHTHPALVIEAEGKQFKVYGGSCSEPVVRDADIYIAVGEGMELIPKSDPWEPGFHQPVYIKFHITDMQAPKDVKRFKKMIKWAAEKVREGAKLHVGCMGGHGRTGTVLSALVAELTGMKDAIQYVRKHYCDHAVESASQVAFLMEHYGVSKVAGYKEKGGAGFHAGGKALPGKPLPAWSGAKSPAPWVDPKGKITKVTPNFDAMTTRSFDFMPSKKSLWTPPGA